MNKSPRSTPTLTAMLVAVALYGSSGALQSAQAEEAGTAVEPDAPAAETTPAAPAVEPSATEESSPGRHRYSYTAEQNRRIAQIKEAARIRRDNMERWRSQRRWWNNPGAEDRRQWNKARSRWYREMAEIRRKQAEQLRPDYGYNYRYRRVYP